MTQAPEAKATLAEITHGNSLGAEANPSIPRNTISDEEIARRLGRLGPDIGFNKTLALRPDFERLFPSDDEYIEPEGITLPEPDVISETMPRVTAFLGVFAERERRENKASDQSNNS